MFKKHRLFTIAYSIVVLLNIVAITINDEMLRLFAMPLIGISTILYLLIMTRLRGTFNLKIFLSLMFAMGGDILLLFNTETEFFLFTAIVATFTGYLLAIAAFLEDLNKGSYKHRNFLFYCNLLLIVASSFYYVFITKHVGEYKIPVMIHFFVLSLLPVTASFRYNRVNLLSFRLIVCSAVCFMVSDYSIAYSSFVKESSVLMLLYIIAYLLAQYFLVLGTIERKLVNRQ